MRQASKLCVVDGNKLELQYNASNNKSEWNLEGVAVSGWMRDCETGFIESVNAAPLLSELFWAQILPPCASTLRSANIRNNNCHICKQ